jgi:Mrp family chromosome partitioning ATPase
MAREQIRSLAIHILARCTEGGLRTIAVTSAMAGEGKTSVAMAVAARMARAGLRVLLVDLDLHRRTLTQLLRLEGVPGAEEAVTIGDTVSVPIHRTDCRRLYVLPAGCGNGRVLSRAALERLCRRARETADLVFLDCPPLMPVAEAYTVGEVADRTILVVRAACTPAPILESALSLFATDRILAAVLNRAVPEHIPYFSRIYGYYQGEDASGHAGS